MTFFLMKILITKYLTLLKTTMDISNHPKDFMQKDKFTNI